MANPPFSFTKRHYQLAGFYGIDSSRIGFYRDGAELKAFMVGLGGAPNLIPKVSDSVHGIRIQCAPNDPSSSDIHIRLRAPLPDEAHSETVTRLKARGFVPPARLGLVGETALLYAYILLHEIGHHVLHHSTPRSEAEYLANEDQADQWALAALQKSGFL